MADEPVEPSAPEQTAPDATSDDAPLSDHQALFGPADPTLDGEAKAKNDEARAKVRHRAASQQATPDDVDEINRLTARARAAEKAAGIARKPNESDRVYGLRVRAELAERHGTPAPQAPTPAAASPPAPRVSPVGPERGGSGHSQPTRPRPMMSEIGEKYAEFEDYNVDLHKWSVEQHEAERTAKANEARQREQFDAANKDYVETMTKAAERVAKFKETHPDFDELLTANSGLNLPQAVFKAVAQHDNGPAFVYHLLTHPDELTEVCMLFEGRPPSDDYVAHATRWLSSRAQAVTTGSAAPAPPIALAPRPPNPVRTGPTRTSDELPGDDSPLSAHEARWGGGRKR